MAIAKPRNLLKKKLKKKVSGIPGVNWAKRQLAKLFPEPSKVPGQMDYPAIPVARERKKLPEKIK